MEKERLGKNYAMLLMNTSYALSPTVASVDKQFSLASSIVRPTPRPERMGERMMDQRRHFGAMDSGTAFPRPSRDAYNVCPWHINFRPVGFVY